MRVTVLGAGSWGTTVAALSAGRNPTMLWARNPEVATAVNDKHENPSYLSGFTLPECAEIRRVVSGEISAVDAYRGLTARVPAGREADPV